MYIIFRVAVLSLYEGFVDRYYIKLITKELTEQTKVSHALTNGDYMLESGLLLIYNSALDTGG